MSINMDLSQYKNKHQGERCYILGNGPSLRDVDLTALKGVTFGTNRIYLSGFTPAYYVCVNPLVLEQFGQEIDKLDCEKFIAGENIRTENWEPGFYSPEECMWEGYTVTYVALQLAYYMGFTDVILLGLDHDYGEIANPNEELVAIGPDFHHFDPGYFSDGTRWNAPDLKKNELAYTIARRVFEDDGRHITNCSSRTKLNVFEILPLRYCDRTPPRPRVSAIISSYYTKGYLPIRFSNLIDQTEPCEIVSVYQRGSIEELITKDVAKQYPGRIVEVVTEDVPSIPAAWNMGIRAATGKYIAEACSDDRLEPEALKMICDILDERQGIDLVYADCKIERTDPDARPVEGAQWLNQEYLYFPPYRLSELHKSFCLGPMPVWRANLHQRFGMFDETFSSAGDYEFFLRCAGSSNYYHIPKVLGTFIAHGDNYEIKAIDVGVAEAKRIQAMHPLTEDDQEQDEQPKIFFSIMNERARLGKATMALDKVCVRAGQIGATLIGIPYMHVHWARDESVKGFMSVTANPNDVLVMLDNDHEHPYNIIEVLANAPAEFGVVGALAFCRGKIPRPAMYDWDADGTTALAPVNIPESGLEPKDVVGTAAIAIKRWVFEKIHELKPDHPPYFRIMYDQERGGEDWYFANLCKECGIQEYVLLDVETPHVSEELITRKTWEAWCAENMERIEADTIDPRNYKTVEAQVEADKTA